MNRNTTLILLAVAALLVGYILLVQVPQDRQAAEATPTAVVSRSLWSLSADQVRAVRVEDLAGGRQVAFARDAQGAWSISAPQAQPADAALAAAAAGSFANLTVSTSITQPADLAAFGLASPLHRVEVTLMDGTVLAAAVGAQTPTSSGYYVQRAGQAEVLVISSYSIEQVLKLLDQPPYLPTPTPAYSVP